jgi:hypothetical protein
MTEWLLLITVVVAGGVVPVALVAAWLTLRA